MDLGSKHISVPMNANFTENIHEPSSSTKQHLNNTMGGISKGLNTVKSNSNNNNSSNLNSTSNLSQANFFRPDNHHNIAGQQAVISSDGENNSSKKIASTNNNNSNSIIMTSGNNGNSNVGNKNNNGINGVRYKECLKNHAASKGGYAVDGCGEFMPSGDEGSLEALKCAACGCHRNFHRRENNEGNNNNNNNMNLLALPSPINASNTSTSNNEYGEGEPYHHHNNNMGAGIGVGAAGFGHYNASAASHHHAMGFLPHLHHHHHHQYMHSLMGSKLVQGAHGGHTLLGGHGGGHPYSGSGGKRFRTKFTAEQRQKMFEFSEKVGWRIQKQDEAAVQQFCAEAGVKRHVLKVWMHNNKNTFGKKLLRFPEAFNALPESSS